MCHSCSAIATNGTGRLPLLGSGCLATSWLCIGTGDGGRGRCPAAVLRPIKPCSMSPSAFSSSPSQIPHYNRARQHLPNTPDSICRASSGIRANKPSAVTDGMPIMGNVSQARIHPRNMHRICTALTSAVTLDIEMLVRAVPLLVRRTRFDRSVHDVQGLSGNPG